MNLAAPLAVLSSVLFGSADFLGGYASRRAPADTVTLVSGWAGLVILALATLITGGHPVPADFIWAVAAGASGGVGIAVLYRAFALGPVSVAAPVISLSMLVVPVLAALAMGERPSGLAASGVVLAGLAFPLLSRGVDSDAAPPRAAAGFRRMLRLSLVSGVLLGVFLVCVRRFSPAAGLAPLVVARLTTVALFLGVVLARRAPLRPPRGSGRLVVAAGVIDSIANVCYFIAVHHAPLAVVGTIVSLSPATTLLIARLVLRERWSGPQRVGLMVAAAAVICVSAG